MKKVISVSLIILIEILLTIYLLFFYKTLHIKLLGKQNEIININTNYKDEGVASCYGTLFNCSYIKPVIKSNINNNKIGNYEILYTIKTKSKTKTVKRNIKVVDNVKPVINIIKNPKK